MGNRDDMVFPEFGAKNHTLPSETDANLAATGSPDAVARLVSGVGKLGDL